MFERLNDWWKSESTRHFLWVPVCFAAGIAVYFSLGSEPPAWLLPALCLWSAALTLVLRRVALPLALGLLLAMAGASYAQWRAAQHQPVMLSEALSPRYVEGRVRDIERTQAGVRLLLSAVEVEGLAPEKTPAQIRIGVKFKKGAEFELPRIGQRITIRAGLMPAMGPALPGGFDFARYFYFRDIGAVGYGLPPWRVAKHGEEAGVAQQFWSWRANLTDRIVRDVGIETGGIAAGLITGDGRAISEEDFDALRASNLYHIIAISGEHMVIISGVIFVGLRLLMLLLPVHLRLRSEGKPVAAAITLVLVTVYIFVTGLPPSAVRAYVMITLVLLAIFLRRHVDPMRSLAIAALLMLLYDPAMLLDPGFRLSFAATLAIIALVESRVMAPPPMLERGRIRMALYHLFTLVLVSVVAECATAPLAISMFNNFSPYGVLANSLATPLVSLFLMPVVALFFVLLPLGLEGVALTLLHQGIVGLLALARWVSGLPHAQIFLPSLPGYGLALFTLGLLWVCVWRARMRLLGLPVAALGVFTLAVPVMPDMLVTSTLKQVAFRAADGFVLVQGRADAMVPEMWAHGMGFATLGKPTEDAWQCVGKRCAAHVLGHKVQVLKQRADAVCGDVEIIFSVAPLECAGATTISGAELARGSVTALWFTAQGVRIENSTDWQGRRLWQRQVSAAEE